MRIDAEEQRTVDLLLLAVQANRLADGQDVRFVERLVECGAAMPGGAERHPLRRHRRVGLSRVIGGDEFGDVDQHRGLRRLSRTRTDLHGAPSLAGDVFATSP